MGAFEVVATDRAGEQSTVGTCVTLDEASSVAARYAMTSPGARVVVRGERSDRALVMFRWAA